MLLDYACTYPNVNISYHASDMILHVESDSAYLLMPGYCSLIAGNYYLSDHPTNIDGNYLFSVTTK